MRLTNELIKSSLSYLNPLKERELDLRGRQIPSIENLGGATDHDAIDLTDNDIAVLKGFPLMPRLRTLLLARNRITAIPTSTTRVIPNVTTMVLFGNRLAELADLDPLAGFTKLSHLVLLENPVCNKEHYRYWVIWRCPSLRFLDYQRIREAERQRASELFGSVEAPTALAQKISNIKSRTFDIPSTISATDALSSSAQTQNTDRIGRVKLTAKERQRVQELIKNAKTLQEIESYEKMLQEGKIPGGVRDDDAMEG